MKIFKKILSLILIISLVFCSVKIENFANPITDFLFGYAYCTNCNARFSKELTDKHVWNCPECGILTYDDTVYTGERFPDTIWLCDGCLDVLNLQDGFNDLSDTYECKSCHFINSITDDNKKLSNEEYRKLIENTSTNEKLDKIADEKYKLSKKRRKTKKDFGEYEKNEKLKSNDLHYGWTLGDFYVEGFTRIVRPDEKGNNTGKVIFLKNPGDTIKVYFKVEQDIDSLNGNDKMKIAYSKNCTDSEYEKDKYNFGRGALLSKFINPYGNEEQIEPYESYLLGVKKGANTKVISYEEGEYELKLNYTIEKKWGFKDIMTDSANYCIGAEFCVKNGNCDIYAFDLKNGKELSNYDITPDGFRLDKAKSQYLKINIKHEEVSNRNDTLVTNIKDEMSADRGSKEYTEAGIYTIEAENEVINKSVVMYLCVGNDKNTIDYFNTQVVSGLKIKKDDEIIGLNDEKLLNTIQDNVYKEMYKILGGQEFVIEDISSTYISKDYLDTLAFNSQENVYYGYTLKQLEEMFDDKKYVFTVDDNGETIVKEFEEYDDTNDRIIRNVAIGSGVILITVTVSVLTAGAAPAVSVVFAASAKTGTIMAVSSGSIGGIVAGITTGIQTNDFDKALKAAKLGASEGFKWGAITGVVTGGAQKFLELKRVSDATKAVAAESNAISGTAKFSGLTMDDVAIIQKESKYPMEIAKRFKSMEEYRVYKDAGCYAKMVNGKMSLFQDIDKDVVSEYGGKMMTNIERMKAGGSPVFFENGNQYYYQLHHINQDPNGFLAVLKQGSQHQGNADILNTLNKAGVDHGADWQNLVSEYWKTVAKLYE